MIKFWLLIIGILTQLPLPSCGTAIAELQLIELGYSPRDPGDNICNEFCEITLKVCVAATKKGEEPQTKVK